MCVNLRGINPLCGTAIKSCEQPPDEKNAAHHSTVPNPKAGQPNPPSRICISSSMLVSGSRHASRLLRGRQGLTADYALLPGGKSELLPALLRLAELAQQFHNAAAGAPGAVLPSLQRRQPGSGGGGSVPPAPSSQQQVQQLRWFSDSRSARLGIGSDHESAGSSSSGSMLSGLAAARENAGDSSSDSSGSSGGSDSDSEVQQQQQQQEQEQQRQGGVSELGSVLQAPLQGIVTATFGVSKGRLPRQKQATREELDAECQASIEYLTTRLGLSTKQAQRAVQRLISRRPPPEAGQLPRKGPIGWPYALGSAVSTFESNEMELVRRLELQRHELARIVSRYPVILRRVGGWGGGHGVWG